MTIEHEALSAPLVGVGVELQHEIEQFLYHEAALLDDRNFDSWFELLADDLHYWMPTRQNRLLRELDREYSAPDEAAHFDETKEHIGQRITRLATGMAWAEDPPSRTRHLVSNVRISPGDSPDEYAVESAFILYRSRLEREEDLWSGRREDVLRRVSVGVGWQVARRTIRLDMATLLTKNLSSFF